MLSPLQERVARIIAGLPEADDFALAGGAALVVRGDVDRDTRDLDFFGPDRSAVDRLAPVAEAALYADGLRAERLVDRPGFVRLRVDDAGSRTEVDLASDARLFELEQVKGLPVLTAEELAVDKVLAVFGRAEARDFVDLWAIEDRFGIDVLFATAAAKDRGFDVQVFAEMTYRFDRFRREEFFLDGGRCLDDEQYGRLAQRVRAWRAVALDRGRELGAHSLDRGRGHGLDPGEDRGLGIM